MDQTNTNIGTPSNEDKTVTPIATAMADAKARKDKAAAAAKAGKQAAKQDNKQVTARPSILQGKRTVIGFETAARICPNEAVASKIVTRFGLETVDYEGIRSATQQSLADSAKILVDNMGDPERSGKPLEMHMQRIVDAFVRSAHGGGAFYDQKAKEARDASSAIANEDRDEDRMGIDGRENRAEQKQMFAAEVGLRAYAVLAAAHGAIDAYEHVCGSKWKPYEGSQVPGQNLTRRAIALRADAFTRD